MDPNEMLATLRDRDLRGERTKFVPFWGHTPKRVGAGPWVLSQWFPASFELGGDEYPTAEHYMMAEKARIFGDEAIREAVLDSLDPGMAKALGRRVQGFDEETWQRERFEVVVRGNLAKFGQDDELADYLRTTGDRVLVEASPRDRIWGIGMRADHPDAEHPAAWQGKNLLGFALMVVRTRLADRRPDR